MESSSLGHATSDTSAADSAKGAGSHTNDHANAAPNSSVEAAQETDLWGALSPMGGPFGSMQPVINVSHAPATQSSAANPFDAFDAFAPSSAASNGSRTSSSSLVLPPPAPHTPANAVVALGSPLISFSPVASGSSSLSLDTTAASTTSTTANAFADDLLSFSFSPVAAPPASSSSSLMMMDDFFLSDSTSASASASQGAASAFLSSVQTTAVETTTSTTTTSSLLSFSPVASAVPQAPFSEGLVNSDLSGFSRGSFSGFEGETPIDHIAPHSAPAAYAGMKLPLEAANEDFRASIGVPLQETTLAQDEEIYSAQDEVAEARDDQGVCLASTGVEDAAVVTEAPGDELQDDSESGAWRTHESQREELDASAAEQEPTSPGFAHNVVDSEIEHADHEDVSSQQPEVSDHDHVEEFESTTSLEVSPPQVLETASDALESVSSTSATDVIPAPVEEDVVEETTIETSACSPQSETAVFSAGDEQVSESLQSPVSSVEEVEAHGWQSQPFPGVEPLIGFDALSTSSGDGSQTAGVADDGDGFTALEGDEYYEDRESDVTESQFDSEATALYAEVDDDDEEYNSDERLDPPVLGISVAPLQLPLHGDDRGVDSPANRVNTPSSVVSSPGSSVAGSAFAFISGGASSFSFTPSAPSPQAESVGGEIAERERLDAEDNAFSPDAADLDVAHELNVRHAEDEASTWPCEQHTSEESVGAKEEIDETEDFDGFSDFAPGSAVDAPTTSTAEAASSFEFQSPSGTRQQDEVGDDDFGGFNDDVNPATASGSSAAEADSSLGFQSFVHGTESVSVSTETDSGFGFESSSHTAKFDEDDDDDDGFGGFGQSKTTNGGDEDDDFGDFGTADAWGSSTVSADADGDDDDDFGDFTPSSGSQQWGAATTAPTTATATSASWGAATYYPQPVVTAAPTDLNEFFSSAFPASKAPVATALLPKPTPSHGSGMPSMTANAIFDQANGGALHKSFHASLQEYRTMLTSEHDEHPHQQQPSFESEALRLKYLKYVLTEKLTEASRPDGVFPHGSEKYHLFASIAESGHEKNMRDALAQLQEGLFQGSVNEAVMRIAKQAALSAKARIAEQAAQQQAHARGSILATTRHFLSRSAASASSGPGSAEKDARSSRTGSGSLGVLTPTSASIHKMSRSAFQNGQESEVGNSSGYGSGEDTGSDVSAGEASGHSEGDVVAAPGYSGPPSGSSSRGGGGLMKKFHERLTSFSSTKQRPRTVSLRRMGQSSEDVVKMELHMESINGGFDEVKWRCAVFLYESEEVSHLAPSQIKILAYPSNQMLSGKSDRSALSKFFKPGTIWSIDIGANSNAGVSME